MPKFIPRVIPIKRMEPGRQILLSAFCLLSITQVYEATAKEGNKRGQGRNKNERTSGDFVAPPVL